jgi:hypothetical protein
MARSEQETGAVRIVSRHGSIPFLARGRFGNEALVPRGKSAGFLSQNVLPEQGAASILTAIPAFFATRRIRAGTTIYEELR